jgi:hypothetical protein
MPAYRFIIRNPTISSHRIPPDLAKTFPNPPKQDRRVIQTCLSLSRADTVVQLF